MLLFYNANYMKSRVRALVAAQKMPVKWLVFDASTINIVDATGLRKFGELREELAATGVSVYVARLKRHLGRFFNDDFLNRRREKGKKYLFQTLKPAISASLKQQREAAGRMSVDGDEPDQALDDRQWREPVELPRMEKKNVVPVPADDDKTIRSRENLGE